MPRIRLYSRKEFSVPLYKRGLYILTGSILAAVSLELFLVKNEVIDGGIVGIAIMLSYLTEVDLGLLLLALNVPFLLLGYKLLGKAFAILSFYGVVLLAMGIFILHPLPVLTDNPALAVIIGGVLLGGGIGLIIRYGGSLDGTEIIAILLSKKTCYTVGQYIMIFNLFILGSSSFVFGIYEALYSLATYFIVYQTMDLVIDYP
ncbi:YitT family protein [Ammoniphilus sp. YIM 78166]|uniref:YitT family protein n=1 Tax=Ammoniphilus sp. YIM 78166 TaxID=1644106 RepID=UPI001F0E2740|nr:YitT family protein [Ammoniphilus sp. YIM 78166]